MDKEEFAQLVIDSTDSLYRVSFAILGNEADCEDAVGEAIATAFAKLHTLRQAQYARTWLTKILIRECYHLLKSRKRMIAAGDNMDKLIELGSYGAGQDYSELKEALFGLSKEQRTVTVLYYLEGYSVKEVAKLTGVSQGTVKSRLARARKHLKEILEGDEAAYNESLSESTGEDVYTALSSKHTGKDIHGTVNDISEATGKDVYGMALNIR